MNGTDYNGEGTNLFVSIWDVKGVDFRPKNRGNYRLQLRFVPELLLCKLKIKESRKTAGLFLFIIISS